MPSHNRREANVRAITVTEYGATPAMADMATPEPGARQVLLKLRAAGMNPMDRTLASGDWKPMPATFPMVLGADSSARLGGDVRRVRSRQRGCAASEGSLRTG